MTRNSTCAFHFYVLVNPVKLLRIYNSLHHKFNRNWVRTLLLVHVKPVRRPDLAAVERVKAPCLNCRDVLFLKHLKFMNCVLRILT